MSMKFERVKPGALIRAEVINSIFDALEILDARGNGTTPGGSAVAITNLLPPPPWQAGQDVQIQGVNFGFSTGDTRLKFDDVPVNRFTLGSSDTLMLVAVPFLQNLGTGKDVTLTVSNGITLASRMVRVVPMQQPQQGNVDVLWNDAISPNPNPNPIANGAAVVIAYVLNSRALLPASYTIGVECSDSAMQSAVQVLDAAQTALPAKQIDLAPGQQKGFFIRIPSVTVANGSNFDLTVSASATGVTGGADLRSFKVGSITPTPDPSIDLAFNTLSAVDPDTGDPDPSASYTANNSTVHLKQGSIGRLNLAAQFSQVGTYGLSVTAVPPTSNWTIVLVGSPTQDRQHLQYVIQASDLVGGVASKNPEIAIQANLGASTTGQLQFTIKRSGATQEKALPYNLALLP